MQPVVAEAPNVMQSLASFVAKGWPVAAAAAAGAMVPRRPSRSERFWFAVSAAITVAFVIALWPDAAKVAEEAIAPGGEKPYPHLLSWLIAIPILGSLAGDDTILLVAADLAAARAGADRLLQIARAPDDRSPR